jgi:hypothetical protein
MNREDIKNDAANMLNDILADIRNYIFDQIPEIVDCHIEAGDDIQQVIKETIIDFVNDFD